MNGSEISETEPLKRRFTNLFFGKVTDWSPYKRPECRQWHFQRTVHASLESVWTGRAGSLTPSTSTESLTTLYCSKPLRNKEIKGATASEHRSDVRVPKLCILFIVHLFQAEYKILRACWQNWTANMESNWARFLNFEDFLDIRN